ncbi:hypothetical protein ABZ281_17060 [Streptomyces sp. NPDC006265]|uniref:hypothetical protein n=1 Tax=Streptomyces sp. NPDC006265 TaxID=3156740 RepID=UPI0033AA3307
MSGLPGGVRPRAARNSAPPEGARHDDLKSFDTVTSKWNRASDHAAVYVDPDL